MKFPSHCELAGRYHVITELKSRIGRTIGWRAKDLAFGDDVAIYPMPADLLTSVAQIAAFEAAYVRESELANPGAVRWHALDLAARVAVREWVNGFTLLDLLRQRRELAAIDVIALLRRLPDILDWLSSHGVPAPDNLLSRTWVAFHPTSATAGLHTRPVSDWPPYQLKLALLHPGDFWHAIGENPSELTRSLDTLPGTNWLELAGLLRELLGARARSARMSPMPTLNEKSNELVLDTLNGKAWKSGREFWAAFVAAAGKGEWHSACTQTEAERFSFSIATACEPVPCRVMALDSHDEGSPPIHLCGGNEFRFGRAKSLVDFPTIPSPETSEKNDASDGISRKHARIEARDGALWLGDGDGIAASSNGTKWNGAPLRAKRPVRLSGRGVLKLANRYSLTLTPVIGEFSPVVTLGGKKIDAPDSSPPGAVIPISLGGRAPMWRAIWILTALGFHLDGEGGIEWHVGGCFPPAGIFIRARNGFWLANSGLPARAVRLGEAELRLGEAAPLLPGQSLGIGEKNYDVSMYD